ncbi:MAG TPA: hypothetical protein VNJ09_02100 [Chthonomonadales bacterium]|nr:hypothetical protein [Chthonomonadales bacterium]
MKLRSMLTVCGTLAAPILLFLSIRSCVIAGREAYTITDLGAHLAVSSSYAYSINNAGQVVGYGTYRGRTRAFLLTPVL